ncbi:MAG: GNAT family N-acetyltransferase [Oligoflexia bacterium]|nr:GNAT family N-acetyltransferase [Oligoflexia bacterium]
MKPKTLGYQSELIFSNFDGKVDDRGEYTVVRTLTNPNFFWGNLLIFPRAPKNEDFEKWKMIFKKEFTDPSIYHMTFAWDSEESDESRFSHFIENGFDFQKQVILATNKVNAPPYPNNEIEIKPVKSLGEWEEVVAIQVASSHDHLPKEEWRKFYLSQRERYKKMIEAGIGEWFGAFLHKRLVASLGIFHNHKIGRYQIVSTHPEHTRKGICGTLVYETAKYALKNWKLTNLVMCADQEYHAARIYESVGFRPVNKEYGLCWWDKTKA